MHRCCFPDQNGISCNHTPVSTAPVALSSRVLTEVRAHPENINPTTSLNTIRTRKYHSLESALASRFGPADRPIPTGTPSTCNRSVATSSTRLHFILIICVRAPPLSIPQTFAAFI